MLSTNDHCEATYAKGNDEFNVKRH
ncbi:hypothetical protein PITCH_A510020 [uncultured Desulfobacterium sp.]|uniref:Uncharacterized protein n=1 Tax=uncultured Desulfobacterium sp. TaxID=201089 RepID=A0A445N0M3_9BACT|nr:hypothetical protein PITCH_A510020 [uncultured Desulfobacterium sp.]